jgi:hypothetical protein
MWKVVSPGGSLGSISVALALTVTGYSGSRRDGWYRGVHDGTRLRETG